MELRACCSPSHFDRFLWPYYVQFAEKAIEIGKVPVLHLDQNWDREISKLADLPAKKCVLNPDGMTDLRRFREAVGDRMAIMGDVSSGLMALGTPDGVYMYVRDLIRDVGPKGPIIAPGWRRPD